MPRREAVKQLARVLTGVYRDLAWITRSIEEAERAVVKALEDALGIPLSPEGLTIRRLYRFPEPRQLSLEEYKRLIGRYMGLEDVEDALSYLQGLGSGNSGPLRARGERDTRRDDKEGR